MTVNFHAIENKNTYSGRFVHPEWAACLSTFVDLNAKVVVDIGCGGGLYTQVLASLGVSQATGVDFSQAMLETAKETCLDCPNVNFHQGSAYDTGLPDEAYDFVLERALIHHLDDLNRNLVEIQRILKPGGVMLIQDRTMADVLEPPSAMHIRGYIFTEFPHLKAFEAQRRPTTASIVTQALEKVGFQMIAVIQRWETRNIHPSRTELAAEVIARTGRSILFELSDQALAELAATLKSRLPHGPIIEKDRWTLWLAQK